MPPRRMAPFSLHAWRRGRVVSRTLGGEGSASEEGSEEGSGVVGPPLDGGVRCEGVVGCGWAKSVEVVRVCEVAGDGVCIFVRGGLVGEVRVVRFWKLLLGGVDVYGAELMTLATESVIETAGVGVHVVAG